MKKKYLEPLKREVEPGDRGLYFYHKPYDIKPKDMNKRTRVFIEQLIPDIVREAETPDEIEFAVEQVILHYTRFSKRLLEELMTKEEDEIYYTSLTALYHLKLKFKEAVKNEDRRQNLINRK